ncbi:TolC family protein [Pseudoxanthomonas winnipegensis]|uniref:TolC family protein n=1 Tax=Pseudoxanthomonas winnipegensis TaxID=2480810 RepID=A0A4Q8L4K4_9GAMM|nr:TolC family protein [Pseudoxanthomonas winnipegensis]TAA20183.1 TolC family protein [Pseudoxanthomonas winnipegensis]TAA20613.1 TolC family protein [Pseudoxanthomonas winnipegensis]
MHVRLAALAAWLLLSAAATPATAEELMTLDDAFARVAQTHPELRLVDARATVLAAERDQAVQRPPWTLGAEVENALGTGAARGLDSAELTLSLSSVLERGGKLDARRTLAQSRIDALAVQRETGRLDLLAETARRYLAVVGADRQRSLADKDVGQRQRTVAAARQRLEAGASPESVLLTAQAALARAELTRDRAEQQRIAARQHLAALWGERAPSFEVAAADPMTLPAIASMQTLAEELERTPELAQFADAGRIAQARLQLARSAASPDLSWQLGVRRLQETDDTALVASLSMPLGSRSRAQPEIRAGEAELEVLAIEREAKGLSLYSTLVEAHGRYTVAQAEVARLQGDVLPKLARAEQAAERAYRAGAISYLEWAQLQSERTAMAQQQLDVALDAQRALIEIQRLTGQALVTPPSAASIGETP